MALLQATSLPTAAPCSPPGDSTSSSYSSSSSSPSSSLSCPSSSAPSSFWKRGLCWLCSSAGPSPPISSTYALSSSSSSSAAVAGARTAAADAKKGVVGDGRGAGSPARTRRTCQNPRASGQSETEEKRREYTDESAKAAACSFDTLAGESPSSETLLNGSENSSYVGQAGMRDGGKYFLTHITGTASAAEDCPLPTVFMCLVLALLLADALQQLRRRKLSRLLAKVGAGLPHCPRLLLRAASCLSWICGVRTPGVAAAVAPVQEQAEEEREQKMGMKSPPATAEGRAVEEQRRTPTCTDQAAGERGRTGEQVGEKGKNERRGGREEDQKDEKGASVERQEYRAEAAAGAARGEGDSGGREERSTAGEEQQQQVSPAASTGAGEKGEDRSSGEANFSEPQQQKRLNDRGAAEGRGGGRGGERGGGRAGGTAETACSAAALRKEMAVLLQAKAEASSSLSSDFVFHTKLQRKINRLQQLLEALEEKEKGEAGSRGRNGKEAEGGRPANSDGFFEKLVKQCTQKVLQMICSTLLKALFCYSFVRALQMLYLRGAELPYENREDAEAWLLLPARFFWPLTTAGATTVRFGFWFSLLTARLALDFVYHSCSFRATA